MIQSECSVSASRDVAFFLEVARSIDVLKWITDDDHPDINEEVFTKAVLDDNNVFIEARVGADARAGFFALLGKGNGVYEAHTNILPGFRGKTAVRLAKLAIEFMFKNVGASEIVTYCFSNNPQAIVFTKLCGFSGVGTEPHQSLVGGQHVDKLMFSLKPE